MLALLKRAFGVGAGCSQITPRNCTPRKSITGSQHTSQCQLDGPRSPYSIVSKSGHTVCNPGEAGRSQPRPEVDEGIDCQVALALVSFVLSNLFKVCLLICPHLHIVFNRSDDHWVGCKKQSWHQRDIASCAGTCRKHVTDHSSGADCVRQVPVHGETPCCKHTEGPAASIHGVLEVHVLYMVGLPAASKPWACCKHTAGPAASLPQGLLQAYYFNMT